MPIHPALSNQAPPLLAASALALWGYATGHWVVAALLALALEVSGLQQARHQVDTRIVDWIGTGTRVALALMLLWQMLVVPLPQALLATLGWTPIIFAPLALLQRIMADSATPVAVLRMSRMQDRHATRADHTYGYVALTLLAASSARVEGFALFCGVAIIAAWSLVAVRGTRRLGQFAWLFALAIAIGAGIQLSLRTLHDEVEQRAAGWFGDWMSNSPQTERSRTRIGDLGRIKLSDRIVMWVQPSRQIAAPMLLRDASFSRFENNTWLNRDVPMRALAPTDPDGRVALGGIVPKRNQAATDSSMQITQRVERSVAHLALPLAATSVGGLKAAAILANDRGNVTVNLTDRSSAFVRYAVQVSDDGSNRDQPPSAEDLHVPITLRPALDHAYREAALAGLEPIPARNAIRRFFAESFRYTLYLDLRQTSRDSGGRSLSDFLIDERVGHCEYFASATVLLLRRAGIPARYATGFSVEEWSELDSRYVVRARHGHAWALAYLNGRWVELDTTPAEWSTQEERAQATGVQPLHDLLAWIARFADGISGQRRTALVALVALMVVVALAASGYWWLRQRRPGRARAAVLVAGARFQSATRHRLIEDIGREISTRQPRHGSSLPVYGMHDTPRAWIAQLQRNGMIAAPERGRLDQVVTAYYRVRFGCSDEAQMRQAESSLHTALSRWREDGGGNRPND